MADPCPPAAPGPWWRAGRFPLFAAARGLSVTGDLAALSALTVHVFQDTASGAAVSGLFAVRVLPRLFGALAGGLSDRGGPAAARLLRGVRAHRLDPAGVHRLRGGALVRRPECPAFRAFVRRPYAKEWQSRRQGGGGLVILARSVAPITAGGPG
ncbi:hypothetical protein [Spongiactinospora sp. 9N601]|uniref:hypothetical protein n=1 Tax=Spongiactinospora sp. 9N601 TaxID=3375149 RepID=UPI0037981AB0